MRKTLIAFATAATLIAVPAAAQTSDDTVTITVETSDLDLTTVAGQDRLESRIDTSIERACRSGGRDLASRRAEAACRNTFHNAFAPQVELAIAEAGSENYVALEFAIKV
ncbi:UrcA family protein [Aurantiacibacter sediminis]|uniref:UrcA family protein n=1 Tax=Aurantiacibacter sediminis TaxID=2793064 RepID=A0ABS0N4R4_9SPHN|nr:UrcA family protein [Aurantiacibacter sediminis]MBH5322660.1 UrcA family protein [Aurantiacibacter sediminis]